MSKFRLNRNFELFLSLFLKLRSSKLKKSIPILPFYDYISNEYTLSETFIVKLKKVRVNPMKFGLFPPKRRYFRQKRIEGSTPLNKRAIKIHVKIEESKAHFGAFPPRNWFLFLNKSINYRWKFYKSFIFYMVFRFVFTVWPSEQRGYLFWPPSNVFPVISPSEEIEGLLFS